MKHILQRQFLILLALAYTFQAYGQWTLTNGPYGGHITCFAATDTKIYAGTRDGGVFLSEDNGVSWTAANPVLREREVAALAVKDGYLFAGMRDGVFRSVDDGQTWTVLNIGFPPSHITAFAIAGNVIYAASFDYGVLGSGDNGDNWMPIGEGAQPQGVVSLLTFEDHLFAGTFLGVSALYEGETQWTSLELDEIGPVAVWDIALAGPHLVAGTVSGIFYSDDLGETWTTGNEGLTIYDISALAVSGDLLFTSTTSGGVFLSLDYGATWEPVSSNLFNRNVSALLARDEMLYAGTYGSGIHRSADWGAHWEQASEGITASQVNTLFDAGTVLYAGTAGNVVARTDDSGETWTMLSEGFSHLNVISFHAKEMNLFAGTQGGGVYKSTDGGVSWAQSNAGLPGSTVSALAELDNMLFAGVPIGIYRSANSGNSWTSTDFGWPAQIPAFSLLTHGSSLYAGTDGAVFFTLDQGANWIIPVAGVPIGQARALTFVGDDLFAAGPDGVFRYPDDIKEWESVTPDAGSTTFPALAATEDLLFAGTSGPGVYVSDDRGESWREFNEGLENRNILTLAIFDDYLYAGTFGSVWKRPLSDVISSIDKPDRDVSSGIHLYQNFPNPFNRATTIRFDIPVRSHVSLEIFDMHGRMASRLIFEEMERGSHSVVWNAEDLSGGIYLCQLRAGQGLKTMKIVLVR